MKRPIALMLLLTLLFSSTVLLQVSSAQIPKPSNPEFTVEQVEAVPSSRGNISIVVKIRNQPFTPYVVDGAQVNLYYEVRTKPHEAGKEAWNVRFGAYDAASGIAEEYPVQSEGEFTILTLYLYSTQANDGKWDIQVQAMIGNVSYAESTFYGGLTSWEFDGQTSDWSSAYLEVNQPSGSQYLLIGAGAVLVVVAVLAAALYLRRRSGR